MIFGYVLGQNTIKIRVGIPQVQKQVNREIAKLMAWSMRCASSGVAPDRGFYDEEFPRKSFRYELMGKELACGWKNLSIIGLSK